jgi:peptidoglycan/xylan/chitin deacetylase (PgdA/CDA1 family)
MMQPTISLKVDVDTYRGLKEGVPALLEIMKKYSVKATFFVSFGPDNSGKAVWGIFKKGFLRKMVRTKAVKLYGLRTILSGTLLPAPIICRKAPHIIKAIPDEGHEIGVHAWDHRLWQDHLDDLAEEEIKNEFEKSFDAFQTILGYQPKCTAAPGWYCNKASLKIQDTLSLDYCSDCRLGAPFYPRLGETQFKTLQIPSSQPCIEELTGIDGVSDKNIVNRQIQNLKDAAPNIFPVHAEVEGGIYRTQFDNFLRRTIDMGYNYLPLRRIAESHRDAPALDVVYVILPGRSALTASPADAKKRL